MIKVIAFDLDDTLWDVDPVILRAEKILGTWLKSEVPEHRFTVSEMREFRKDLLANTPDLAFRLTEFRERMIHQSMLASGIESIRAEQLTASAMSIFLTARNEVTFYDGALDTINHLAGQYQLGALTNGNADITRLGLDQLFSFAFSSEEIGAPKPAPDLFHKALSHTGCDPHEMVYVGDDPIKDVHAANEVGMRTIWLRHAHKEQSLKSDPDVTISNIGELPEAISRL